MAVTIPGLETVGVTKGQFFVSRSLEDSFKYK